ncbi:hypothetical protein FF38_04257 [Lucilia cuprina]|uniref:Uncharacterized protein n=1 Tax=Lucilia cuprina TaxID=7375 RepID=A0A0L0C3T5_LUCCU|nr:hypothetical protein FF38_04257 [Lucilia cuprina]
MFNCTVTEQNETRIEKKEQNETRFEKQRKKKVTTSSVLFDLCDSKEHYYTTGKRGKLYNKIHNIKRYNKILKDFEKENSIDESEEHDPESDWEQQYI